jgi:hypothetical protein
MLVVMGVAGLALGGDVGDRPAEPLPGGLDLDAPVALPQERIEAAAAAFGAGTREDEAGGAWWRNPIVVGLAAAAAGYAGAWANEKGYLEGIGGKDRPGEGKDGGERDAPPVVVEAENSGDGDQVVEVNIYRVVRRILCGR